MLDVVATEGLEVVLPVSRPMTAKFELRDGDAIIPWPKGKGLVARGPSGQRIGASYGSDRKPSITVQQSATYWIVVPKIDGYLPHDDVAVDMKPGPLQTIIVQMTRS